MLCSLELYDSESDALLADLPLRSRYGESDADITNG